jgi:hypothetical protein
MLKKFVLGIAAVAALGITTAFAVTPTPTPRPAPPPPPLRVEMACSPLTSSQSAQPGDAQRCRIRLRNSTASPIENVVVSHPTPNTVVARFAYKGKYGVTCDTSGCDPFTLPVGGSLIIIEDLTFNATQDGRGKTTATATGTLNGKTITASGQEQNSLP